MSNNSWIKDWDRDYRLKKIFILGGRSGTTLIHKCLLITGLVNWGLWSLHTYESEPFIIKHVIYSRYPRIYEADLRPEYPFEIAKCPEFGFVIDLLEKAYPNCKYIITQRDLMERVDSHIRTWGRHIQNTWDGYPNWKRQITGVLGEYPKDIYKLLIGYTKWRDGIEKRSLSKISDKRKLYVDFNNLMGDFLYEMNRIADFVGIPADNYRALWCELREIKLMATASDVKKYIK